VIRAIELSVQDFAVHDGVRTLEEHKEHIAAGASQTLDSRHLSGHAVDLVCLSSMENSAGHANQFTKS
jgi:peptidoglycan LD-endopeptidase CwlK